MGNILVNFVSVKILFDSGASHCFMSRPFSLMHDFISEMLSRPLGVLSPGLAMKETSVIPNVSIKTGNYSFLASPYVLGNSDIDPILSMDWLAMNKSSIDCEAK